MIRQRCYSCGHFALLTMKMFMCETPAPEDGMVEQELWVPVCKDADACCANMDRDAIQEKVKKW